MWSCSGDRARRTLRKGTYLVENAALGNFLMFIVPGPTTAAGTTYTATFNRVGTM